MQNQIELEKLVIGEFISLRDKEKQLESLCELDEVDLFTDKKNQDIVNTFAKILLNGKVVDTMSIYNAMKDELTAVEIASLDKDIMATTYLPEHIFALKELKYKRNLIKSIKEKLEEIKSETFLEEIETSKDKLIADLNAISVGDISEFIDLKEYKQKISEHLNSTKDIEGFSWGISDLDNWTSGIVTPRFYVIGGLKKSGKTRFTIHTIKSLYLDEVRTAFLSMEMPAYEVTKMLCSSLLKMDDIRLRSSSILSNEERQKFESLEIDQSLLGIECKPGLKIEGVLSRIRRYAKLGYKVVFIDYLQRINHNRNKQATELEEICIKIADSSRTNNIAVVLLSQYNAAAEREIPNMGSLKGSGGIGETSDTILLLDNIYRRTKNDLEKGKMDVYIESRYGDSGKLTLWSNLGSCEFKNFSKTDFDF